MKLMFFERIDVNKTNESKDCDMSLLLFFT